MEYYVFAKGVGGDVAETGDGPGSFRTKGNVWHLTYGNPEVSFCFVPCSTAGVTCAVADNQTGSATTNGGW